MNKREIFWIVVVLVLLVVVVLISGIFYFSLISGNFGTTGHVVLTKEKAEDNSISGDVREAHVDLGQEENFYHSSS